MESGLVVVTPVRKVKSTAWAFLKPFTVGMWSVTAAFFLLVGAVVWILEHRINSEFRGPPSQQIITIIWSVFLILSKPLILSARLPAPLWQNLSLPRQKKSPLCLGVA